MKIDLLEYILENYIPRRTITYKNKKYSNLNEQYEEWFNETYTNGVYYIGKTNIPITTITRSIGEEYYIINQSNRYHLGFRVNQFKNNHQLKLTITCNIDNKNTTYHYSIGIFTNNHTFIPLDSEITPENITGFTFQADSVIENDIKYEEIPSYTVNNPSLIVVTLNEYNNIIRKGL